MVLLYGTHRRTTIENPDNQRKVLELFALFLISYGFIIDGFATDVNSQLPALPFHFPIPEENYGLGISNGNESGGDRSTSIGSFLDPCETLSLQTPCTEEEYENDEDCLPQKTDNCDHSKELLCLAGVCLPNCHPHKEIYDHLEGNCYRKVGSECRAQPFQTNSTVVVPPCQKFSSCERHLCRCSKGYTYENNKCVLYAGINQFCNESISCDVKSDIICKENVCQCRSETQYYHLKRKRCYILIDQVCSSGLQFCPDNSFCLRRINRTQGNFNNYNKTDTSAPQEGNRTHARYIRLREIYRQLEQSKETEGEEKEHFIGIMGEDDDEEEKEFLCKCADGYGSTRDKRFCLGLHGSRCNTLHRCNGERGLKCYEGKCICNREREQEQIYSEQFQTCVTKIGSPCTQEEDDICPIGASCLEGKCSCDQSDSVLTPSFSIQNESTVVYSCLKGHGMGCRPGDPFDPPCNHEMGLECKGSGSEPKCLCGGEQQFYDVSLGICMDMQKTPGKIPVIHFTPPDDREYNFKLGRSRASHSSLSVSNNLIVFAIVAISVKYN